MSPNHKRETARVVIWAIAATTILAVWVQAYWVQS
jgi:hypothetical protein